MFFKNVEIKKYIMMTKFYDRKCFNVQKIMRVNLQNVALGILVADLDMLGLILQSCQEHKVCKTKKE